MSNQPYAACAAACRRCITACERCLEQFAAEPRGIAMLARVELCRSCARLCTMAVDELSLGSAYLAQICGLCAVVCRACAEECSEHAAMHYRACATACLRAAAACHAVATNSRGYAGA